MRWWLKAAIQAGLSLTPGGEAINHKLQLLRGFREETPYMIFTNVGHLCDLAQTAGKCGLDLDRSYTVEVGTGWMPTLPVGIYLLGGRVHTYDHVAHLRPGNLRRLIDLYPQFLSKLARSTGREISELQARLAALSATQAQTTDLSPFGIHYHAPGDATQTHLPDASIDLYMSVAVLEHVPISVVVGLLREAYRVLKPGGLTYHHIGLHDHYDTVDSRITQVNFLKYRDITWRLIAQNKIHYTNRMRASEFVAAFRQVGFDIVNCKRKVDERSLEALGSMRLAKRYRGFEKLDLATCSVTICAQKPR